MIVPRSPSRCIRRHAACEIVVPLSIPVLIFGVAASRPPSPGRGIGTRFRFYSTVAGKLRPRPVPRRLPSATDG